MTDRPLYVTVDPDGNTRLVPSQDTSGMMSPVRCAYCRGVYDLGSVTVTARYVDCSVWRTPCCNREVDDRGETGWKSTRDYYRIDRT